MGLSLHDYVIGERPWRQLERVLERLPAHSHYKAAINDDDEFAEQLEKLDLPGKRSSRPPLAGYDDVAMRLDNIYDALNAVVEVLVAVNSKKGSGSRRPNRAPRPETARERLRRRASQTRIQSIEDMALGRAGETKELTDGRG